MKRLFLGVAAALACAAAHAQTTTWTFTYTGFYDDDDKIFRPDVTLKGEFTGSDQDADGILERAELSAFQLLHGFPLNLLECPTAYPEAYSCAVSSFSFSPQGGLAFMGEHSRSNMDTGHTQYITVDSASSWNTGYFSGRTGESSGSTTYLWTPETSFHIVSSVPEPGQAALLALGLAALAVGGLRRRPRNGAPPPVRHACASRA